jgi:cysteine-rich repeat protein
LVFDVDKINQKIIFYPKPGSFFLKEIYLSGFSDVPDEILKSGTLRGGLLYFLNDRFATKKVLSFEVSNHEKSSIKQTAKGKKVVFSFSDTIQIHGYSSEGSTPSKVQIGGVIVLSECGNGTIELPYEECDDGNTEDGDGCSFDCKREQETEVLCRDNNICEYQNHIIDR